jgi:GNAT superfamily N-acetyltransferase
VLRVATEADVAAVVRLVNLAFAVEAFFKIGDRTNADEIRAMMGRGEFLLLEDPPGVVAGCVYVTIDGGRGYFGMLSIDPARQGSGLGRRLVEAAERRCLDAGCGHMHIHIVNLREELPPFYRRLGYVETGTLPFPDIERATRPCHFIVMTKALRTPAPP